VVVEGGRVMGEGDIYVHKVEIFLQILYK